RDAAAQARRVAALRHELAQAQALLAARARGDDRAGEPSRAAGPRTAATPPAGAEADLGATQSAALPGPSPSHEQGAPTPEASQSETREHASAPAFGNEAPRPYPAVEGADPSGARVSAQWAEQLER